MEKLKGWRCNFLSQAGREILIKSMTRAIPTYVMQCFALPCSILDEIEKICWSFFQGQKGDERKLAWVAWEKMFVSKREGGLGFRDLRAFNKAMLAKQVRRLLSNLQSFMVRIEGKYFSEGWLFECFGSSINKFHVAINLFNTRAAL